MTNHGIEFTKKIGVSDFIEERKKKDGSYDEQWNRIYKKKLGLRATVY